MGKRALAGEAVGEPDVPLVEADHDLLVRAAHRRHVVGGGHHRADEAVHVVGTGQEGLEITVDRLVVGVRGDVVDDVEAPLEHLPLPGAEGGHPGVARAARDQLQAGVEAPHGLAGLLGQPRILLGGLVADLPGPVHLVAEAPQADAVRLEPPVLDPTIGELGSRFGVAVLQQFDRFDQSPGAQVHGDHRLDADPLAPLQEVVGADLVASRHCARPDRGWWVARPSARPRSPRRSWRRSCRRDSAQRSRPARASARQRHRGTRSRRPRDGPARRCRCRRSGPCARRRNRTARVAQEQPRRQDQH